MLILFIFIIIGAYVLIKKNSIIVPSGEEESVIGRIGYQASEHKIIAIILGILIFVPGCIVITIVVLITLGIYDKAELNKEARQREARRKYVRSLLPTNTNAFQYYNVNIPPEDAGQLNANIISLIVILDDNRTVAFPESSYKYNRQYYLLDVHFQPRLNHEAYQEQPSRTYKAFLSDYKTYNGPTDIQSYEVPTNATLVMAPTNLSRTIRIQLNNITSSKIRAIEKYALLGTIEKNKLGLK